MKEDPVAILKTRLARGEITVEQYQALSMALSTAPATPMSDPRAEAPRTPAAEPGPSHDHTGEGARFAARLRELGYMIDPGEGRVLGRDDQGVWNVIGTLDGWFRFWPAVGQLLVILFLFVLVLTLAHMVLGFEVESLPAVLSWIPWVFWGLLQWHQRDKWQAFLRAQEQAMAGTDR